MAKEIFNGKYPTIYALEEHGERYMLGSDVGIFLGYYKGALYKRYPSLHRRILNSEERLALSGLSLRKHRSLTNMGTMVVRASEAMAILTGQGECYRQKGTRAAAENNKSKEAINVAFCRATSRKKDLPNLRENLSFIPGAKERATAAGERKKLRQEIYYETQVSTRTLRSLADAIDYPCPDSIVINSVSLPDANLTKPIVGGKNLSIQKKKMKKKDEADIPPVAENAETQQRNENEYKFFKNFGLW